MHGRPSVRTESYTLIGAFGAFAAADEFRVTKALEAGGIQFQISNKKLKFNNSMVNICPDGNRLFRARSSLIWRL
jgi:hypothetical protein